MGAAVSPGGTSGTTHKKRSSDSDAALGSTQTRRIPKRQVASKSKISVQRKHAMKQEL